ncbi:MAG: MmcB family DNA repair protein [Hyphomicrobiales bacterium]|nr:MmcB family DNA repair protein [Hyphomicrobiales bacterium]
MVERDPIEVFDGRQSEAAAEIQRGACRYLRTLGHSVITELPLASGHRADILSLSRAGDLWIMEIKSCLADFRADHKWPAYRDHCDRLFFAVAPDFPMDILPQETGLIVADRYGGELVREAPEHRLAAARRKAVTLRFARAAALRLHTMLDPGAVEV